MAKLVNMRGLQQFIADIRGSQNKEQEKLRVDKELGKIRKKFASGNVVTEYDKKKYVWKLLYIYMLGYDVEFGHKQAADLIPAVKYAEKQVGYMACAILLNEKDEFLRLIINSIRNDLISRNEAFQCLALGFVGNVGGAEMASLLTVDVMNLLTNGAVRPIVRKKAALCLLRLIRKSPPEAEILAPDVWSVKLAGLLEERDLGVLLALVTLLLGIVSRSYEGYESLVPKVVRLLERLQNVKKEVTPDYTYYGIASPWLQVKCLRVLQYFPRPDDPAIMKALLDVLRKIISGNEVAKNINKNNAQHAIVFEAVALALALEADTDLLTSSVSLLGKFISVREPNIKYLGLENMVRLAEVPAVNDTIVRHQKSIIATLKDPDVSIRRRGLDLLFTMCNSQNAPEIVDELLKYLNVADFSMRDELVLKTAVLAERFFPSLQWYVDVMLTLIERSGEFATKDIWHAVAQLITGAPELHEYAAVKAIELLQRGTSHEPAVCCAAYLLGEYGRLVKDVPTKAQFALLHERFVAMSAEAKGLLLSVYMKMVLQDPSADAGLKQQVLEVYDRYSKHMDADLQQRAVEDLCLIARPDVARRNVVAMPPWEKRKSLLLRRLTEKEGEEADEQQQKPVWLQEDEGTGEAITTAAAPVSLSAAPPAAAAKQEPVDFIGLDDGPAPSSNGHVAPAAAPAAASAGVDPLADLFGLDAPAAAPTPAPMPRASDPFSVSGDLHGLMGGAPPEIRPVGDPVEWFGKLCVSSAGVLYEDAHLQVGMKLQFQGSQGQLVFFLGNKAAAPLERLILAVPPQPQFAFQLASVPGRLDPNKQIQVPLMVACVSPFLEPPRVQIAYTLPTGQQCNQTLPLPIVVSKFCTPPDASVPREVFFNRWRALAGPPQKQGQRVQRLTSLSTPPVEQMLTALGLGVQHGIDPDPENIVAVATFSFTPAGQQPQQVPIMVRVEVEKAQHMQFQVTVATPDVNTTSALKDLIAHQISKM
ncbi:hypothetical protein WJX72_009579 [[Myrmecia] bisecta]|uniref:AP-2 complex subunit alpha n=1 Tax=[Myrmecia] bisecta TaxID=41462 RepID=A0AAW1PEU7_9CHLO